MMLGKLSIFNKIYQGELEMGALRELSGSSSQLRVLFLGAAMQGFKVLFVVVDELRCGDLDGALSCPVLVMIIIFTHALMCCYYFTLV